MADNFKNYPSGLDAPLLNLATVTPNDAADLPTYARSLHVGTGGDLRVTTAGGQTVTLSDVAAGWHPIRVARVWATGTTASGITAGW